MGVSIISSLEIGSPLAKLAPRWLIKALKARKIKMVKSMHKEMTVLIEAVTTIATPMEIPPRMTYLVIDK